MVCLIVVWLIVWNWVKFETFWKLNKREWNDFPKLSLCILILRNSNSFHHKTLEWRWYDFFHLKWKGFWKDLNSIKKYFKFETLRNSMIFRREDKMTSSIIWNMSWKLKRIKLKVIWKYFENPFQFGVIWILFKLFFSKNEIHRK
jgi:hypothetical protein